MKKTIESKNEAFWKKSKPSQRIAVAKDVLKNLDLKFYKARSGTYLSLDKLKYPLKLKEAPKQLNKTIGVLRNAGAKCEVCGVGSCFVSLVNLGNNFTTSNLLGNERSIDIYSDFGDGKMRILLRKVFEPSQLTLIEQAFEKGYYMTDGKDIGFNGGTDKAIKFGQKYKSDTSRLKAIMNNIIKNKGTFIP